MSRIKESVMTSRPKPELPKGDWGHGQHSAGPIPESVGWSVVSYLITGPALFGFIGWLCDRMLGTGFLVVVGILGGMALSLYLVWFRYGSERERGGDPPDSTTQP